MIRIKGLENLFYYLTPLFPGWLQIDTFVTGWGMEASNYCMMQHDDAQLISRILKGDVRGYEGLVDQYKDLAYTIAFRILGKREDSEEVVQDAFVKAFHNLSTFRHHAKFSTWLYRIVYNTAVSKKRLKGFPHQLVDDYKHADTLLEEEEDTDKEQAGMMEMAMKQLTEEERTIVTLYYIDESSVDDIHTITGLTR